MALVFLGYTFMLVFVLGLIFGSPSKGPVAERPSVAETPLAPAASESEAGPKV
jgi:hypothetical protein